MNNSRNQKRYLTLIILYGVLSVVSLISVILFSVYNIGDQTHFAQILIILATIAFADLFTISLNAYLNALRFASQLELENSYTLGYKTTFYNFDAFKNKAVVMSRKRKLRKYRQFIIAFTASSIKVTSNTSRNDMVTSLNYFISLYLSDYFYGSQRKGFAKYNIYGFNRGIFLIYIFTLDEKNISTLINEVSANLYRIVKEKNLKIYVQPFFGIKEVDKEENVVSAIEDAFVARNVSESNYETYTFFSPSFKVESTSDDINDIEEALRKEEFVAYYQPKFSLKENKFVSVEALARWDSSKYGFLTPAMFIDKAENAGMISLIDNYIFERALRDISSQIRKGRRVLPVSVNFSIYEFYSQGFIDNLVSLLAKYNVPAHYVEIEITETTSQANQFLSISIIKKLKEIGIRVLMDDFGVGYSGIDNLRKIPFDAIKIDKSYADHVLDDEKTKSIIKFMVELGHINGVEVIIEGVDNQKQVDLLRRMKIDTIQGFYYSQALPLEKLDAFLRDNVYEKKEEENKE